VVGAAHDVGDAGVVVVDHHREVVDGRAVGAGDHEVVLERVLELRLAPDDVDDRGDAFVGRTEADRAGALVFAAEAALAVGLLEGLDVLRPRGGAVGAAGREQLLDHLGVAVGPLGLEDRLAVPVDSEPLQRLEDLVDVLGRRALAVGVLDPQHHLAGGWAAGEEPVVERGPGAADVQRAGRRGSEADAGHADCMLEPPPTC
jgi:hypothetical protein